MENTCETTIFKTLDDEENNEDSDIPESRKQGELYDCSAY